MSARYIRRKQTTNDENTIFVHNDILFTARMIKDNQWEIVMNHSTNSNTKITIIVTGGYDKAKSSAIEVAHILAGGV